MVDIRTDDAAALAGRFKMLGDADRFEFFLDLYRAPRENDPVAVLLAGDDAMLKMMLLKYLEEIPESHAVRHLLSLLEDSNEIVRELAGRSYERNQFPQKYRFLRPFVLSKLAQTARFAIKTLSEKRDVQILPALLDMLASAQEGVREEILKALRFFPEARLARVVADYADSPSESIRHEALATLATLSFHGVAAPVQIFLKASQDSSPRIRRVAIAALGQYPGRLVSDRIAQKAFGAQSEDRLWAVQALAGFPNVKWVPPLTELLAGRALGPLRLQAEITLKRFPRNVLKAGLMPLLESSQSGLQRQSALLLAEILGFQEDVRARLFELWDSCRTLQDKLALMDVLRELGGDGAFHRLFAALVESPLLAYAAASILNRIMPAGGDLRLLSLLKEGELNALARQALLGTLSRRRPSSVTWAEFLSLLKEGLKDPVTNVRYLSLEALRWYPLEDVLVPILELLSKENAETIPQTAARILLKGLGRDPRPLVNALKEIPPDPGLLDHVVKILAGQAWDPAHAVEVLSVLREPPIALATQNPQAFFSLACRWIQNSTIMLERVYQDLESKTLRLGFISALGNAMSPGDAVFPPIPLEFLSAELSSGDVQERKLLYRVIGSDPGSESLALMTRLIIKEDSPELLSLAREFLKRLSGAGRP